MDANLIHKFGLLFLKKAKVITNFKKNRAKQ